MTRRHVLFAFVLSLLASAPARAGEGGVHRYLYVVAPGVRDYLDFGGAGILVFDIANNPASVKRLATPASQAKKPANIKGVCASIATRRLYFTTPKALFCFDLV